MILFPNLSPLLLEFRCDFESTSIVYGHDSVCVCMRICVWVVGRHLEKSQVMEDQDSSFPVSLCCCSTLINTRSSRAFKLDHISNSPALARPAEGTARPALFWLDQSSGKGAATVQFCDSSYGSCLCWAHL